MLSKPVENSIKRSNPSPKPECGTDPYLRSSMYHQYVSSSNPTSASRLWRMSSRSSRWLPPISSPTYKKGN